MTNLDRTLQRISVMIAREIVADAIRVNRGRVSFKMIQPRVQIAAIRGARAAMCDSKKTLAGGRK
jgi:hypothetical protein